MLVNITIMVLAAFVVLLVLAAIGVLRVTFEFDEQWKKMSFVEKLKHIQFTLTIK